jgi:hypothetical protein
MRQGVRARDLTGIPSRAEAAGTARWPPRYRGAGCGPKPRQARAPGAVYHTSVSDVKGTYDAVLECCGELVGA